MLSKGGESAELVEFFEELAGASESVEQSLEVAALELQATSDPKRRRAISKKVSGLAGKVVADPRTLGVLKEMDGRTALAEHRYSEAYEACFDSFKHYQECGNGLKAKEMLKLVVVASLLARSDINPFDTREARALISDPEVAVFSQLRAV
jgi:COP9 signalosome complex subunit 2